jgi:hypothetical protein
MVNLHLARAYYDTADLHVCTALNVTEPVVSNGIQPFFRWPLAYLEEEALWASGACLWIL